MGDDPLCPAVLIEDCDIISKIATGDPRHSFVIDTGYGSCAVSKIEEPDG